MTLENTNCGSEYGIEKRLPGIGGWVPLNAPGLGCETYKEAYQKALKYAEIRSRVGYSYTIKFRVVVYNYDGSKRKNIRNLTIVEEPEPWVKQAMEDMLNIAPTGDEDEK